MQIRQQKQRAMATQHFSASRVPRARASISSIISTISFFFVGALFLSHLTEARGHHSQRRQEAATGDKYLLGVGKADITGPVVEIGFAGYADLSQTGTGLRQRIFSRSFIVADVENPDDRFVYMVLDTQSGDTALRNGILEGLAALGDEYAIYGAGNVAVTGTHSHSGPGAWFNYLLPQITSLGYNQQSYQAVVDGAVESIKRAHESLEEGYLDFGTTNIDEANLSRSLYAYMNNPEEERAQYDDSVDKEMTVLRFQRASDSKDIGILTWFPVHGTSVYQNSTHVTGDNKGVAEIMFEDAMESVDTAAEGFVAGFSQANVGDTTGNVLGAWCDDGSGDMCSYENSTCADGKSQSCHGRGPLFEKLDLGVSSCYEIGTRQYNGARSVYDNFASSGTPVVGSTVKSFHFFHDMSFWDFTLPDGTAAQTCKAALGYGFAAGTTDGPGAFDFTQNDPDEPDASPVWSVVSKLLRDPSDEQVECQKPKPVLLDVGEQTVPYDWSPNIIDVQMLRVGQFVIIISPSEATTMSGRRWRNAVSTAATEQGIVDNSTTPKVVLGGPANTYAHYVATPEEYDIQRYEGASTLFGRYELPAYINLTVDAMHYLAPDSTDSPEPGPTPQDNRNQSLSFITGVVQDTSPIGINFGDCIVQPLSNSSYTVGSVVNATFQAANPRNNLRLEGTFTGVEKKNDGGEEDEWTVVRDDSSWFLVYTWERTNTVLGHSEVTVSWETGELDGTEPGTYRIRYYGDSKAPITGKITAFEGVSDEFVVVAV